MLLMGYILLNVVKDDFCGIVERIFMEVCYIREIFFSFVSFKNVFVFGNG